MQVATRPRLNAGIALVGATAVVASTVALRPPDVHLPALPTSVPVQLVALENPLAVFGEILQKGLTDTVSLGSTVLASPAPILSRIITNQLANATALAGISESFLSNVVTAVVQDVPQQTQMGIQQIANGEITNGLNSFVGALLLPLVGPGLGNLALINDVVPILKAPVQNVLNLLDVAPTVLLNVGIAPIQVLSNFTNALGNGIEGLRDAVLSGNPENVFNAVINAAAGFAAAAENSLLDPNSGVIGIMLNVRNIIANALAPKPAVPETAASIPDPAAKTLTLTAVKAKAPEASAAASSATTGPEGSAAASSAPSSEKDGTTGAASGAADGTQPATDGTDGTSTDGTTKSSTDTKSGSDTASSSSPGPTSKGDTDTKGDSGTTTGTDTTGGAAKGGDSTGGDASKGGADAKGGDTKGGAANDGGQKGDATGKKASGDGSQGSHDSASGKHAKK
jgi:hypothetical protein